MSTIPLVDLNNGTTMPQLGFGVFQVDPGATEQVVRDAIDVGYRSIDTAAAYDNEEEVGKAIAASSVDRDDLFVTTKVWNSDQGANATLDAFDRSRKLLGLDVIDLYLIHWPAPGRDLYVDTWLALEKLLERGQVRTIGVSNFQPDHLERILAAGTVTPAVNQIELHPGLAQPTVRQFNSDHGIKTEAWSPLARGKVLDTKVLRNIAEAHDKTVAQVVLRWHLELGNVVIPRTTKRERMVENLDVVDFSLSDNDIQSITQLEDGERVGSDPDTFNG